MAQQKQARETGANSLYAGDLAALQEAISQTILGKDEVIELILTCLLAHGHILIEDVPGVGKTTLALALAKSIHGSFQRIQFTSDLLPSDVIGVPVYNSETRDFDFKPGPIFANIVLADEINRTTPKTQSALLEAMQDNHVTVERKTHPLPDPFMVIATQNPIEFHGTYPLPESQLDRFLMRITMGYPKADEEFRILNSKGSSPKEIKTTPVCSCETIKKMQAGVSEVRVDDSVGKYILSIVNKTREHRDLELGVSPRGSLALYRAVQAWALVHGRTYTTPDDVKTLALPILAHRVIVSGRRSTAPTHQDARTLAATVLDEIINTVEVPI